MSNNQLKKKRAEEFNAIRKERLALEQDRRDNPEKYKTRTSEAVLSHALLWSAMAPTKKRLI